MPVDPNQVAQDPDFQKASPDDKIAYLSSQDADFAKASRFDQLGYIAHLSQAAQAPKTPTLAQPSSPNPGFGDILHTAWERMKQAYAGDTPVTDDNTATLSGVGSIARGTVKAAKGMAGLIKAPSAQEWEQAIEDNPQNPATALLVRRIGAPAGDVVKAAGQIPAAIRDINASPDPLGTYMKAGQETAGEGAGQALVAIAGGRAAEEAPKLLPSGGGSAAAEPGIIQQVIKGKNVAQPQAEAALRGGVKAGAEATGEPSVVNNAANNPSMRTGLEEPIDTLHSQAKDLYQQVDAASGTDFKGLSDKLKQTELKIRLSTNPADEAAWEAKRTEIQGAIEEAKKQAGPEQMKNLDTADKKFQQASALEDLQTKVFHNPDVVGGNAASGTPETVNVDSAVKQLQRMQDKEPFGGSRLEQALGKPGAKQLLDDMYAAQRLGVKALTKQQWAKWTGSIIGGAGIYEAAKKGIGLATK